MAFVSPCEGEGRPTSRAGCEERLAAIAAGATCVGCVFCAGAALEETAVLDEPAVLDESAVLYESAVLDEPDGVCMASRIFEHIFEYKSFSPDGRILVRSRVHSSIRCIARSGVRCLAPPPSALV
ncbi:hypothetical protein [Arthrobacter pascens]|uniref:hypothetical protein n=1 Tax=Arthrobacter pascens TaxID=1677 RepID=UPI0027D8BCDD|nr:hypothetical protein [Arthrobacter pascens]